MNWRRGLIRVWAALSLCWIIGVVWIFTRGCFYFSDSSIFSPVCATGGKSGGFPVAGYLSAFDAVDWLRWGFWVLVPPVSLLASGTVAAWALRGFHTAPK